MKPILIALPAILVLTACAQPGDPNQRTKNGAIVGAAVGGLLGANSTDDNKLERGLIGAALGGAVGGAIGNELDKQAGELRRDLDSDIGVVNTGSELRVTMPQDLLFATDSASLRGDLVSDIRVLAANLGDYPNSTVFVVVHNSPWPPTPQPQAGPRTAAWRSLSAPTRPKRFWRPASMTPQAADSPLTDSRLHGTICP